MWTDRVITIGRVSAKTWWGPNYKVLKHSVVRHSWYYFQYSQCLINYPINIRQIYDECLLFWMTKMSVHTWLEISCLSSVCQGCCTWNPENLQLQPTTDISRDFSLRLSKRLADSDLAVIGRTGIGPVRNISYWTVFVVLTQWKFLYCIDRFDNIKANKSRLINNSLYL